jgi:thioesterase domain-containing protein
MFRLTGQPAYSPGTIYDFNVFLVEREEGWRASCEYNPGRFEQKTIERFLGDFGQTLEFVMSNADQNIDDLLLHEPGQVPGLTTKVDMRDTTSAERRTTTMPASVAQARFWSFAKLDPGSPAFNMPAVLRLSGALSVDALERSFQFVIRRHESLRTTFGERDGMLTQVVADEVPFSLIRSNLTSEYVTDGEARVIAAVKEEALRAFDLARGPLIRGQLFRLGDAEYVLVIVLHHIISDGWSQSIFQRELWTAYEAFLAGVEPNIEPLEIQYGDFAAWQQEWLRSEAASEQRRFWMANLAEPLPIIDFPLDRAPINQQAIAAQRTLAVPKELVEQVRELCKREGVTAFTFTLSCFAILLSQYALQDELIIGSPAANRQPEVEQLIGPFAGPIALRLDLSGNPTFREILQRAQKVTLAGLSHADYPFELLAKDLKVRSVGGRNPLFQFYFFHQTAFLQGRELTNLRVVPRPSGGVGTPFEMQLAIIERADDTFANLDYNSHLFDSTTIDEVLRHYDYLLRALVADPALRVRELNKPSSHGPKTWSTKATVQPIFVAPGNEYETLLAEIWQDVFGIPKVGIHDDFFALGGNSLRAADFVSRLERASGLTVDLSTIIVCPTVEKLAQHIQLQGRDSLVVPLRVTGSRRPLFCMHPSGGHLFHYLDLVKALPDDQPVYGLRPPNVDNLRHIPSVERLASIYVEKIKEVQKRGPYQLCGMSFGGLLAFEVASQLVASGGDVKFVALFDTSNPGRRRFRAASDAVVSWTSYIRYLAKKYYFLGSTGDVARSIHRSVMIRARMLTWRTVRRVCRMLDRPVPAQMHNMLDAFDALGRAYRPRSLVAKLILVRAQSREAEWDDGDFSLGWNEVIESGAKVHVVPGDHISMMRQPHVLRLAEVLEHYLATDD